MQLCTRKRLASVGLCSLLSLTLIPAVALPCPGEPEGTLSVNPRSATFESRAPRKTFLFTWLGSGGGTGSTELNPTEHFRISSDACRGFSFSNGRACAVQVEMTNEGRSARLTVRAGGREATAEFEGRVAGRPTFTVTPEAPQTFERVGVTRRFSFVYSDGPVGATFRKFALPSNFEFQENTCTPFLEKINPGYTCEFVLRLIRASVASYLEVEVWKGSSNELHNIPIIG